MGTQVTDQHTYAPSSHTGVSSQPGALLGYAAQGYTAASTRVTRKASLWESST